tara:strand:+ start:3037 stop:3690 length:654 start_codon:yes stop_codon:yes gene_type:complete
MNKLITPSVLALWLVPIAADLKPISFKESEWAKNLPVKRVRQFKHSRGYVREALSELFNFPALEIPLDAPPGKPPELPDGWGFVSFSHCLDCLLIGWSPKRIGVDLERLDRDFEVDKLTNRLFSKLEIKKLFKLTKQEKMHEFLKQWVIKEAAIKWQRGSILKDFSEWDTSQNSNKAIHKSLGYITDFYFLSYEYWFIAIALEKGSHNTQPILCQKV